MGFVHGISWDGDWRTETTSLGRPPKKRHGRIAVATPFPTGLPQWVMKVGGFHVGSSGHFMGFDRFFFGDLLGFFTNTHGLLDYLMGKKT